MHHNVEREHSLTSQLSCICFTVTALIGVRKTTPGFGGAWKAADSSVKKYQPRRLSQPECFDSGEYCATCLERMLYELIN